TAQIHWWSRGIESIVALLLCVPLVTASPVHAESDIDEVFQHDFCLNYFIAACPVRVDFVWRTNTPINFGEPPGAHDWASLVAPATTYLFYSPAPEGKHTSWNFGLAGFGWDWW